MSSEVYDPSDDEDTPAEVIDLDETEPVQEIEEPEGDLAPVPEDWGQSLTDEDWNERFEGVEVTQDPEDGTPGEGKL